MFRYRSLVAPAVLALAASVGCAVGCSVGGSNDSDDDDDASGEVGGGGDDGLGFDGGTQEGGLGEGETCLAETASGEEVILDVFLVVDRSGSMSYTYWDPTVSALKAFFSDAGSAGINVAMNLFPSPDAGTENVCNPNLYDPVQVANGGALATLPADKSILETALDGTSPSGTTPMYGALDGTYKVATAWQDAHPDHKVIVILSSDGEPCCGDCDTQYGAGPDREDISTIAELSFAALSYNNVSTYGIIIDPSATQALNAIAQAGGTTMAYDVSGSNISQFTTVLEDIRANAMGCEFVIPEPQTKEFDPHKVNVVHTQSNGIEQTLPKTNGLAECAGPGWYYDDPVNPTKIILCPNSCTTVESDELGKVDLAFGCPTKAY